MKLKVNKNHPTIFEINIYFLVSLKCFVYINDLLIEFKPSFWSIVNLVIIAHNAPLQNMCSTTFHHIHPSFKTLSNSSSKRLCFQTNVFQFEDMGFVAI